jgi:hypothetical protein
MSQFKELLVFGTSRFLDSVYAKKFIGPVEGTADRAIADNLGQTIDETYIKDISGDGSSETITFTMGDGTTKTFTTKNTQVTVVDNLASDSTTDALSAAQGKALNTRLTAVENSTTWTSWDPEPQEEAG